MLENATVEYNSASGGEVKVYKNDGTAFTPDIQSKEGGQSGVYGGNPPGRGGYYNEIQYFIRSINKGEQPVLASLKEGIDSFMLVNREIASISCI